MRRSGLVHALMHYNPVMGFRSLVVATFLVILPPASLAAAGGQFALPLHPAVTRAAGLTLDEAVAKVEKQFGARAVRAEESRDDGRVVYRIRLLSDDGRVFDVTVDAATGQVD